MHWVGPLVRMSLTVFASHYLIKRIEVAKALHFGGDRENMLRRPASRGWPSIVGR